MAKIGEGTLSAWMRLGLAELRQAVSLGGNIDQPVPYGMYGTLTPGEVADARRGDQQQEQPAMDRGNGNLPSPSQVIDNPDAYLPGRQGQAQGRAMDRGNDASLPSPSQVIDNPQGYRPGPQPGHEQQHEHGHEM